MIKISDINDVLHSDFLDTSTSFQEPSEGMKIDIDKKGCKSIMFSFDKKLGREYKGGLFPFFAKTKEVCSICDYMLFAIKDRELYILLIELKRSNANTSKQLRAAECFANYIVETIKRVKKSQFTFSVRKISIKNPRIRKKKTKITDFSYDEHNHTILETSKFYLKSFLK